MAKVARASKGRSSGGGSGSSGRRGKAGSPLARPDPRRLLGLAALVLLGIVWLTFGSAAPSPDPALRASAGALGDAVAARLKPAAGRKFYFAYASDMLEERLRKGSSPSARKLGPAYVAGRAFEYSIYAKVWRGGVGDLVPVPDLGRRAWGVLYEVPAADIAALDQQKGVAKDDPKYKRITVEAVDADGRAASAITYVLHDNKRTPDAGSPTGFQRFKPTKQYRSCVVNGARQAGLPADYLEELAAIPDSGETFQRKSVGRSCDLSR